ncbi:hypothetical protein [Filomicrobium sp.]|nr:hypothetical protein [Filomicrobium sp.]
MGEPHALGIVETFVKSFEGYPAREASFDASTSGIVENMMAPSSR